MTSYRTIIDHLAELHPNPSAQAITTAALRLLPQGENITDSDSLNFNLETTTRSWATRLAFESLRDWSWPYWMNLQTNPASGIALTALHQPLMCNLLARDLRPVVDRKTGRFAGTFDSRGMFTPPGGNFSVEFWMRIGDRLIRPSCIFDHSQIHLSNEDDSVNFSLSTPGCGLKVSAQAKQADDFEFASLQIQVETSADHPTTNPEKAFPEFGNALYITIRPYTSDSVVPVHDLVYNSKGFWMSDNQIIALFPQRPDVSWASDASHGDAGMFLTSPPERTAVRCSAGMATAINAFHLDSKSAKCELLLPLKPAYPREIPLDILLKHQTGYTRKSTVTTRTHQENPDKQIQTPPLLAASLDQLIAATDIAEPTMQKVLLQRNHWIVPAVRALLLSGHRDLAARLLNYCALGLGRNGYLPKCHGRWAFAGQFLTALADFYRTDKHPVDEQILRYSQVKAIGRWIVRKRREVTYAPKKPTGLFPPGMTRDGIGREYQLADNLWGIEGLEAASWLARQYDEHSNADAFHGEAANFASQLNAAVNRELEYGIRQKVPGRLHRAFDPASAAELLDLALTQAARELLAPVNGWLLQVISALTQPLHDSATESPQNQVPVKMDERGISPARHIMLALLQLNLNLGDIPSIRSIHQLVTASGIWPEYLDYPTQSGRGALHFDPEAAALYILLTRKLKDSANNRDG